MKHIVKRTFCQVKRCAGITLIIIAALFAAQVSAQIKTEETKTTTDSQGVTTTTHSTTISKTEDITPINHFITVNPLKLFLYYNLTYYQRIATYGVVGVGVQIPTLKDINGFGVNAEIRLHPSAKASRGFYIAPNYSYNSISSTSSKYDYSTNTYSNIDVYAKTASAGLLIGWQWFPGDEFAIGLGLGADYYMLFGDDKSNSIFTKNYEGTIPALRFDVGYGW